MGTSYNPPIVTDGLVFCVDAANQRSYPKSGTTWSDLVGSNDGTMQNMTASNFSDNNGGILSFDGVNEDIDCGTNFSDYISGTKSFSIECFVYPQNSQVNYADIWGNHTSPWKGLVLQQNNSNINQYSWGWGYGNGWTTFSYFNIDSLAWSHIVAVRDGTSVLTYVNGSIVTSDTSSSSLNANSDHNFLIARGFPSGRYWKGNMSNFRIYSKALTPDEIRQNYEATVGRYK